MFEKVKTGITSTHILGNLKLPVVQREAGIIVQQPRIPFPNKLQPMRPELASTSPNLFENIRIPVIQQEINLAGIKATFVRQPWLSNRDGVVIAERVAPIINRAAEFKDSEIRMADKLEKTLKELDPLSGFFVLAGIREKTLHLRKKEAWGDVVLKHIDRIAEKTGYEKTRMILGLVEESAIHSRPIIMTYNKVLSKSILASIIFHMSGSTIQKIYPKEARRNRIIDYTYAKNTFYIDNAYGNDLAAYKGAGRILALALNGNYEKAAEVIRENWCDEGVRLSREALLRLEPDKVAKIVSHINSTTMVLKIKHSFMEIFEGIDHATRFLNRRDLRTYIKIIHERIKELYGATEEDLHKMAQMHFDAGDKYYKEGKYDLAILRYEDGLLFYPESAEARKNLRDVYQAKHQYEKAMEKYQEALKIDPNCFIARGSIGHKTLGLEALKKGDVKAAIREFELAIDADKIDLKVLQDDLIELAWQACKNKARDLVKNIAEVFKFENGILKSISMFIISRDGAGGLGGLREYHFWPYFETLLSKYYGKSFDWSAIGERALIIENIYSHAEFGIAVGRIVEDADRAYIQIICLDSGPGLDPTSIMKKVPAQEIIIPKVDAKKISDEDVIKLLFKRGFRVSERGIGGIGLRKDNLSTISEIATYIGKGTKIVMEFDIAGSSISVPRNITTKINIESE